MSSISDYSQYHNLNIYKKKDYYTKEEKQKILGAYYYLVRKDRKEVHKLLTDKDIEVIKSFNKCSYKCYDGVRCSQIASKKNYFATLLIHELDVSGYSKISLVKARSKQYDKILKKEDFEEVELYINRDYNVIDKVDLSNEILDYIKNKDNFREYVESHNEIVIDKYKKLVISSITIRYDLENDGILSYNISGYLLEK